MKLIFNSCGEFRWSPEGPVSQIHSPHLHAGAPWIFSDLSTSVQMLKREWGAESNGKLPYLRIPSKTATLVPEFAVEDLPLGRAAALVHSNILVANPHFSTHIRSMMAEVSERRGGWNFLFPLSAYCKALYPSLRSTLYCSGMLMYFVWQPPSNSLFVAVTDYTTLLFCFDSTRYNYYRYLRRRKVSGRGIYT